MARSLPRSQKSRQDPPKSALKMPILGSMCAILAPTWPILAPRCAPTGLRREPRARPNQHLGASWRQAARQEPPHLPGAYICSRFCFHLGTDFVKKLLRMLWKTFVLFSLFPFHAKPGLTRQGHKARRIPCHFKDTHTKKVAKNRVNKDIYP